MIFHYSSFRIAEIARAPKFIREGQTAAFKRYGDHGRAADVDLDLGDGPLLEMRLRVSAGRADQPTTYEAALLLADQRIRGIGHSATRRGWFYKEHIPRGWHENVIDPSLPTRDPNRNRHEALLDFAVTDLEDFLRQVCERWHIVLTTEKALL
jgi:hypothetical protein